MTATSAAMGGEGLRGVFPVGAPFTAETPGGSVLADGMLGQVPALEGPTVPAADAMAAPGVVYSETSSLYWTGGRPVWNGEGASRTDSATDQPVSAHGHAGPQIQHLVAYRDAEATPISLSVDEIDRLNDGNEFGNYKRKVHHSLQNRPDVRADITPADARFISNRGRLWPALKGLGLVATGVGVVTGAEAAAGLFVEGMSWSSGLLDGGLLTLPFATGAVLGSLVRRGAERYSPKTRKVLGILGGIATSVVVGGATFLVTGGNIPLAAITAATAGTGYMYGHAGQERNYREQYRAYAKNFAPVMGDTPEKRKQWRKEFLASSPYETRSGRRAAAAAGVEGQQLLMQADGDGDGTPGTV